jgi:hypothetical protein
MGEMAEYYAELALAEEPIERKVKCKYCGKKKLEWYKFKGKWRLINRDGSIHVCPIDTKGLEEWKS